MATKREALKRDGAVFEIVDLRAYPLPFFDEPKSPMREPSKNEVALRWARKVAELDAFIFVTGEYNHSIPASLKNAEVMLDDVIWWGRTLRAGRLPAREVA
jgi:NAD(P)H-dependent FMN reductase